MKRKILLSTLAIATAATAVGGGTFASFHDNESTAAEPASHRWHDGPPGRRHRTRRTSRSRERRARQHERPGQGYRSQNTGTITASSTCSSCWIADDENSLGEPEIEDGDTAAATIGELDNNLNITVDGNTFGPGGIVVERAQHHQRRPAARDHQPDLGRQHSPRSRCPPAFSTRVVSRAVVRLVREQRCQRHHPVRLARVPPRVRAGPGVVNTLTERVRVALRRHPDPSVHLPSFSAPRNPDAAPRQRQLDPLSQVSRPKCSSASSPSPSPRSSLDLGSPAGTPSPCCPGA